MTEECRFCSGKPVRSDFFYGSGLYTMRMMPGLWGGRKEQEDDADVLEGIQLKNGNRMIFDSSSGKYVRLGIEIKHCPFCGKVLDKIEEEYK